MRRGTAALLLATVGVLAACGGSGSGATGTPLSRAQLAATVNAECQKLQSASNDLINAQAPSAHGARVAHYLTAAASQLRSRIEAIGRLVPPSSLASQVHRFVSLLTRYADQLDALAGRTRSTETYNDLLGRSTAQVTALNNLSDQANTIAANLGFNACTT